MINLQPNLQSPEHSAKFGVVAGEESYWNAAFGGVELCTSRGAWHDMSCPRVTWDPQKRRHITPPGPPQYATYHCPSAFSGNLLHRTHSISRRRRNYHQISCLNRAFYFYLQWAACQQSVHILCRIEIFAFCLPFLLPFACNVFLIIHAATVPSHQ